MSVLRRIPRSKGLIPPDQNPLVSAPGLSQSKSDLTVRRRVDRRLRK